MASASVLGPPCEMHVGNESSPALCTAARPWAGADPGSGRSTPQARLLLVGKTGGRAPNDSSEGTRMADVLFSIVVVGFFAASCLYAVACDRL